jgi:hypothetical protein
MEHTAQTERQTVNRRNFIQSMLTAGAAFTILPGAGRLWVPTDRRVVLTLISVDKTLGWAEMATCKIPDEYAHKFQLVERFFEDEPAPPTITIWESELR